MIRPAAKALLAEAGFANGFQTTLLATAQFGMHKDTAEVVQQHLAAIGIQCELQLPDWSTRVSRGTRGQYDMAIHGVSSDNNDPDGLTVVLDTSLSPTHGRSFKVDAPRTIAALAKGRSEFDQAKRVEIYKEMQRAALEEVPLVGLARRSQGYGMDKSVMGFTNLPGALTTVIGSDARRDLFRMSATWFARRLAWFRSASPGSLQRSSFSPCTWCRATRPSCCCRREVSRPIQQAARSCAEKLGLERPLLAQYGAFLAGLMRGDLGQLLVDDYPVLQRDRAAPAAHAGADRAPAPCSAIARRRARPASTPHCIAAGAFDRIAFWRHRPAAGRAGFRGRHAFWCC